jgi:hypothetical protein
MQRSCVSNADDVALCYVPPILRSVAYGNKSMHGLGTPEMTVPEGDAPVDIRGQTLRFSLANRAAYEV